MSKVWCVHLQIYRGEVEEAAKSVANYGTLQAVFEDVGARSLFCADNQQHPPPLTSTTPQRIIRSAEN